VICRNVTQIRVIGTMVLEICMKMPRNLIEKLPAKFPATMQTKFIEVHPLFSQKGVRFSKGVL